MSVLLDIFLIARIPFLTYLIWTNVCVLYEVSGSFHACLFSYGIGKPAFFFMASRTKYTFTEGVFSF